MIRYLSVWLTGIRMCISGLAFPFPSVRRPHCPRAAGEYPGLIRATATACALAARISDTRTRAHRGRQWPMAIIACKPHITVSFPPSGLPRSHQSLGQPDCCELRNVLPLWYPCLVLSVFLLSDAPSFAECSWIAIFGVLCVFEVLSSISRARRFCGRANSSKSDSGDVSYKLALSVTSAAHGGTSAAGGGMYL